MQHLVHTCCYLVQYAYTGTCSLCIWQKASHICLLQTRPPPSSIMLCRYRYNVFSDTKHRMNHGENVSANSHYSKEAMYNTASYMGLGIMSYAFNQYPPRSHDKTASYMNFGKPFMFLTTYRSINVPLLSFLASLRLIKS